MTSDIENTGSYVVTVLFHSKVKAAASCETLVPVYQTARRCIPEGVYAKVKAIPVLD
jgi:hypothetical protein